MSSLNEVNLIGNVGRDPELKTTHSGERIANFSIATSESWKDKSSGEKKQKTEWHNIVAFGDGLAGVIDRFVKKGTKLYVSGTLRTRKWQDGDGKDKYSTEVVLSGFGAKLILLGDSGPRVSESDVPPGRKPVRQDLDDEIPF